MGPFVSSWAEGFVSVILSLQLAAMPSGKKRTGASTSAPAGMRGPRRKGKRGPVSFQSIQCTQEFVLKGGCVRTPMFLPTVKFQEKVFVKLHIREQWLCQLIAGKSRGLDPLRRTSVIQDLHVAVAAIDQDDPGQAATALAGSAADSSGISAPAGSADHGTGMLGFGLDAEPPAVHLGAAAPAGTVPAPQQSIKAVGKISRRRKKNPAPAEPKVVEVSVPPRVQDTAGTPRTFTALTRPPGCHAGNGKCWVLKDELDWILPQLRQELVEGGVAFQPAPTRCTLHFSIRDSAWCARAKCPLGTWQRKQFAVARCTFTQDGRRRALSQAEFVSKKHQVRQEAQDWIAEVSGEVV